MYKRISRKTSLVKGRDVTNGEPIELKVRRLIVNKEPIGEETPLIYTAKSDGVMAAYNIRTDRWELATEAMDKVTASKLAQPDSLIKPAEGNDDLKEEDKEKGKVIDLNDKTGKTGSTPGKTDDKKSV